MVKCICIDDKNKPEIIPESKWIKEENFYHIIEIVVLLPSNKLGVKLKEVKLTKTESPYEFYKLERFGFITPEDLEAFFKLLKDCMEMDEVLKQNIESINEEEFNKQINEIAE